MSTPLEKLEQQYAAEVVKAEANEDLLKRLERGIRGLKGVAESAGVLSKTCEWIMLLFCQGMYSLVLYTTALLCLQGNRDCRLYAVVQCWMN